MLSHILKCQCYGVWNNDTKSREWVPGYRGSSQVREAMTVEQVKLLDRFSTSNKSLTGTLYLTATHLLFIDSHQKETWILHHHIALVEKLALTTSGCPLVIQCKNFRIICETYPRELYVPRIASKPIIVGSSKFRSKGRFPVLSYYHQNKEAAICRCSQPLSGFSARCLEDEHLLQAISKANPVNRYMYVMDTRPKLNAMANRAAGKGYENEDNYSNIRFQFVGIENIHAIMVENASVLVHCSDGWDRTSQVLIEKDWISFGHKFSERCGHLDGDPKEVSPVFTQFLECVWHLTEQFPQDFEFNEAFLLQIHEHIHSCQFGNFLGNCQKEREELKLKEKTYSLWPFLLDDQKKYLNPLYSSKSPKFAVLEPNTVSFSFKFWRNMYHQFDRTLHPRQSVFNIIMNMNEQNKQLEKDIKDLESKIKQRKNKQTDEILTKESLHSVHPESPTLKTSLCFKEQTLLPVNHALRTIEGSNPADNRYSEYAEEFSKSEPGVVSLEYVSPPFKMFSFPERTVVESVKRKEKREQAALYADMVKKRVSVRRVIFWPRGPKHRLACGPLLASGHEGLGKELCLRLSRP
ncbi:hypothetical protein GH733_006763 [Mirounga leonina]|nr:hypothetical protein GH733_006763 [Mirounga leonina]